MLAIDEARVCQELDQMHNAGWSMAVRSASQHHAAASGKQKLPRAFAQFSEM